VLVPETIPFSGWVSLVPISSAAAAATISESYVSWWGIHSSGFVHNFFSLPIQWTPFLASGLHCPPLEG
jgi:hypothetical protein